MDGICSRVMVKKLPSSLCLSAGSWNIDITLRARTSPPPLEVTQLVEGFAGQLGAQPTSLAADRALLHGPALPCRVRTCVQYRLDQKELWQTCLHILQCWQRVTATATTG